MKRFYSTKITNRPSLKFKIPFKIQPPDLSGFRDALKRKDSIASWLKFSDICVDEDCCKKLVNNDFNSLLLLLNPFAVNQYFTVFDKMKSLGIPICPEFINHALLENSRKKNYDNIKLLIQGMKEKGIALCVSNYNTILRHYTLLSVKEGLAIAAQMKLEGIQFDTQTYSILISCCTDYDICDSFYSEFLKSNLLPTPMLYSSVINMYFLSGRIELATKTYHTALECDMVDGHVVSALLYAYHKLQMHLEFDELVNSMKNVIDIDNQIILTLIIQNYLSRDLLDEAFLLLNQLKQRHTPDMVLNQSIIDGCCKVRKPIIAFDYLKSLLQQGQPVNLTMYKNLLQGLSDCNSSEQVYMLFEEIKSKKLMTAIYNIVLKTAMDELNLEKFKSIWKCLELSESIPNEISYTLAFEMYTRVRKIKDAKSVLLKLHEMQYSIDKELIFDLISGAIQLKMYEDAAQIISLQRKSKLLSDPAISLLLAPHKKEFQSLINSLGKELKEKMLIDTVEISRICYLIIDIYKEIENLAAEQPEALLIVVMDAFRITKDLVSLIIVWNKLEKLFPNPNPNSIACLLKASLELGHAKTGLAVRKLLSTKNYTYNLECYHHLLSICIKYTDGTEVPSIIIDMINNGFEICALTWNIIRTALDLRRAKDPQNALEVHQEVYNFFQENFPEIMINDE